MDRGNTKQEILEASLELFSVQGFEATSISQIADAVGVRKASLYSHFENKQAILDALVKNVLEQYGAHSIFAKADWEEAAGSLPQTADDTVQMIQGQIRYASILLWFAIVTATLESGIRKVRRRQTRPQLRS